MRSFPRKQQGVVLVVGLIMLLLVTLLVSSAFTLSSGSLEAVSNQQWRSEAVAAADVALEQVISSAFTTNPVAQSIGIDLNRDSVAEYIVAVSAPVCEKATLSDSAAPSSVTLPGISNSTWNVVFAMQSTVQDQVTGASTRVRTGARVLLNDSKKQILCP